ncbi:hypothetical protein ACXR0O_19020 [Verrucomicrobiota bacterium sgz303538]
MPAPQRPKAEKHSISFDPRIWEFLQEIATDQYDGNHSAAVNSFVLHNMLVKVDKEAKGEKLDHWITRPAMRDPEQLESLLLAIKNRDPQGMGAYFEVVFSERKKAEKGSENSPS